MIPRTSTSTALLLVPALLFAVATAHGYDFVWQGGGTSLWGGGWTCAPNYYCNGWGNSWVWWEDPTPYFPGTTNSVLIPGGLGVEAGGGITNRCGTLTVENGAIFSIPYTSWDIWGPTLVNDGLVHMTQYAGNYGIMNLQGDLLLSGVGLVQMDGGRIRGLYTIYELTVGSGQQITGYGELGDHAYMGSYHALDIINNGQVRASTTAEILRVNGGAVTNNNLFQSEQGGILALHGIWDNSSGRISATDASKVVLSGVATSPVEIIGGTLEATGSGWIQPTSVSVMDGVTLEGLAYINRYDSGHLRNGLTNNGTFEIGTEGWVGPAELNLDNSVTIDGVGTIEVGEGNVIHLAIWPAQTYRLTLGPDQTLLLVGGRIGTQPDYYGDRRVELVSSGTIVTGGSVSNPRFNLAGSGFTNSGSLGIGAGTMEAYVWGSFSQTAGQTVVDGAIRFWDAVADFTGGVLMGGGTVTGTVTLGDGAQLAPGASLDTLTINGNLGLQDGAEYLWEFGIENQDLVAVSSQLTLDGTIDLSVSALGLGAVSDGDYVLLTFSTVTGSASWSVHLPPRWACDGVVVEDHQVVLKNLRSRISATFLEASPGATAEPPPTFALLGAVPNPFNPVTTIRFTLPQAGPVSLVVFDVSGRLVRSLVDDVRSAGWNEVLWDGRDDGGRAVSSGQYRACLAAGGQRSVAPLVLVR